MEPARPRMQTVVVEEPLTPPNTTPVPPSLPTTSQVMPPGPTGAPTSPQNPTTPQVAMDGRRPHPLKKLMFIIPALLLLGTIAVAGYFTQKTLTPKPTPTPAPTEMPELIPGTPVPTPKPIIKPKTYLNSSLKFSLKYSGELMLTECSNALHFTAEKDGVIQGLCDGTASGAIKLTWSNELTLKDFGDNYSVQEDYVKVGGLDGTRQIATKKEGADGAEYEGVVTFSKDKTNFTLSVTKKEYEEQFNSIMQSFEVIDEDPTRDWKVYSNSSFRYTLKHPEDWTATISASQKDKQIIEIAKAPGSGKVHTLLVESTINVPNAQISASDIASSTKNLLGWKTTPSVDLRSIGTGAAQVIQGQFDSNWQVFVVIWYKNRIVQMSWVDTLDRAEQKTFDNILSTFKFLQ